MLKTADIAWTAGFLEGEGYFCKRGYSVQIAAAQVQAEPLLRLKAMFGGYLYRFEREAVKGRAYYRWSVHGQRARELMMTLYVFMSPKRRAAIQEALASWRALPPRRQYRTHCPKGHAYDEKNTLWVTRPGATKRWRACRACKQVIERAGYQRRRARALGITVVPAGDAGTAAHAENA